MPSYYLACDRRSYGDSLAHQQNFGAGLTGTLGDMIRSNVLPIIIAVCALVLSVIVAWQNWQHNKLSVKPILNLNLDASTAPLDIKSVLTNNGTGPAIITEVRYFVDGKRVNEPDSPNEWRKLLVSIGVDLARLRGSGQTLGPRKVVKESAELVLVFLGPFEGDDAFALHQSSVKALQNLGIEVDYESIYGEAQNVRSHLFTKM